MKKTLFTGISTLAFMGAFSITLAFAQTPTDHTQQKGHTPDASATPATDSKAKDAKHDMGMMNDQHSQGMMNDQHSQGMMNDQHSQGMMNGEHKQGMMNMENMQSMMKECMETKKDGKMCDHEMMETCHSKMDKSECKKMMKRAKAEKGATKK